MAQSSATTVLQSSHRFAPRLRGQIILGYIFTITVRACLNAVTSIKISKVTLWFCWFCFLRYDDYDVPDTMNVHGIYDTKASMVTFESRSEFQKYLQEEAGVSGSYFGFYAGVKVGWGESETQASQKYMALLHVDINRYIKTLLDCYFPLLLWFKVVPSLLYKYSTGGGSRERVWWVRIFARLGQFTCSSWLCPIWYFDWPLLLHFVYYERKSDLRS